MRGKIFLFAALLLVAGCATHRPAETVFRPEKLAAMDVAINTAIADQKCPGGVLWLEHDGVAYHKAYGSRALVPMREPMTEDTIFDAASLTKVVATTPAVMRLVERGQITLVSARIHRWRKRAGDGARIDDAHIGLAAGY